MQGADWGPRPEAVWDTGFVQAYDQYLNALSVEQYVPLHAFEKGTALIAPRVATRAITAQ